MRILGISDNNLVVSSGVKYEYRIYHILICVLQTVDIGENGCFIKDIRIVARRLWLCNIYLR